VSLYTSQGAVVHPEPLRAAVLEGRVRPLSRSLALRMLAVCCAPGPWRVSARVVDDPPTSLSELMERWPGIGPVPVSGEHAEHTIWGHPDLNAIFRAWHDSLHVLDGREFSPEGELAVARLHLRVCDTPGEHNILWAETEGQSAFHRAHGVFPRLQRAFVVHCVRVGVENAVKDGTRFL
jgi:hypothetical protein